jgi:hypothetical protein
LVTSRLVRIVVIPNRLSWRQVSNPMPLFAPVTMATLLSLDPIFHPYGETNPDHIYD